ncbi:hypothetical protein D3C85_1345490 [compost metagenome]
MSSDFVKNINPQITLRICQCADDAETAVEMERLPMDQATQRQLNPYGRVELETRKDLASGPGARPHSAGEVIKISGHIRTPP